MISRLKLERIWMVLHVHMNVGKGGLTGISTLPQLLTDSNSVALADRNRAGRKMCDQDVLSSASFNNNVITSQVLVWNRIVRKTIKCVLDCAC